MACYDDTVDGDAFTGLDDHDIAVDHGIDGNFHFPAFAQNRRRFRPQADQSPDGVRGAALGPGFQPFAQQHQGDDHSRRFEIERPADAHLVNTETVGSRGAQRHQQVHIAGTGLQRLESGDIEPPAQYELYGRREQQFTPGRQVPAQAQHHADHL